MLRTTGIIEIMAPVHLPHGATVTEMRIHYRNSANVFDGMRFTLVRKNLENYSVVNELLDFSNAPGLVGDATDVVTITNNNVVNNARYSYRLYARFDPSSTEDGDTPSISDIEQRVYGIVIEYTIN